MLLPATSQVGSQVRARRKTGPELGLWTAEHLAGSRHLAPGHLFATCRRIQVTVVNDNLRRGRWRGARVWFVGGEWGQCATWWTLWSASGGRFAGARKARRNSPQCVVPRACWCSNPPRSPGAETLNKDSLKL